MRRVGLRFELGVKLRRDEKWMVGDLDDFDEAFFLGYGSDDESGILKLLTVGGIEFVTMAMTLVNRVGFVVNFEGFGVREDDGFTGAETHGGAHVGDALLFFLQTDDGMSGFFVEFGRVGFGEAADVSGVFDGGNLHAEADSEVGYLVFAGVLRGNDFTLDTAIAKSSRDEDAIDFSDDFFSGCFLEMLGIDLDDFDFGIVFGARDRERFVD